jgi:hypothetical protein|tara:strand:+ start:704 stop:1303 length:600 start_codon:yes stop_codon:yes gene_type:complete
MAIKEPDLIHDKGFSPLTPFYPNDYQGKQVIINADRLILNSRQQLTQEAKDAANTYEGGDIHLFSHNFISFNTNGSVHINAGDGTEETEQKSYFVINAPNLFLGLDDGKEYPTEPAVLGNKNQDFLDKFLDLIQLLLTKLSDEYRHTAASPGLETTPIGETFEDMRKDYDGNNEIVNGSIGELRKLLRDIKSQHIFLRR